MRFWSTAFLIALSLFACVAKAAPSNPDVTACEGSVAADIIAGCSRLLQRPNLTPQQQFNVLMRRGNGYWLDKQFERALSDFDAAVRLNPKSAAALANRAGAFRETQQYDRAIADASESLKLDDKNARTYWVRGTSFVGLNDFDRAIADFTRSISLEPKFAPAYSWRAIAWKAKGDDDRALYDADQVVKLLPNVGSGYNSRCLILENRGEYEQALPDCENAVKLAPDNALYHINRGIVRFRQGNVDRAMEDFTRAIRLDPADEGGYSGRGEVLRAKRDFDRALSDFDRAVKMNPKSARAYVFRGLTQEAKGDFSAAQRDYGTALTLPAFLRAQGSAAGYYRSVKREQDTARARLAVLNDPNRRAQPQERTAIDPQLRRIALVIGNGAYENTTPLTNPANDARAIAKALRSMGFEVIEGIDLKHEAMRGAVNDFLRGATNARIALAFYAGHGIQIDGRNFLLPVDVKLDGKDLTAGMTDVDQMLAGLDDQLRTNIVILDACRNNPVAQPQTSAGASRSVRLGSGLAAPSELGKGATTGAGTLLAYATAPGQVALDGDGENSPFSAALARHIGTPGLEVQVMLTRVRAEVVAATKGAQVPWSSTSLLGEVYLVGGKP
jgi:tetratricopeptide (TPR) repeat protein